MQLPEPAPPPPPPPAATTPAAGPPAARSFRPIELSPQWVVELGEPQDVAALEGGLAGDEDGERDGVRRFGHLAVPDPAAMASAGDGDRCRARSEVAMCLVD